MKQVLVADLQCQNNVVFSVAYLEYNVVFFKIGTVVHPYETVCVQSQIVFTGHTKCLDADGLIDLLSLY